MDINEIVKIITGKLGGWMTGLIDLLPNLLLATLVFIIGLAISKWLKKFAERMVTKVSRNSALNGLIISFIHIFFIGIVIFTVLSILHLDKAVTSILAGAGIIGLALAFAFQDIAANFISGVFISFRKPFMVGDIVQVLNYMGKVEQINLRDTIVKTFQGLMVIIPNKDIFQNPIENFSLLGKRRLDLAVGVSYGDDLEKVKAVTLQAVASLEGLSPDDETTMFYNEFGDSSINFIIRFWVNTPEQIAFMKVGNDAVMKIKKAYDNNNITIPFPIRTLDFGIKGGASLSEMKVHMSAKGEG